MNMFFRSGLKFWNAIFCDVKTGDYDVVDDDDDDDDDIDIDNDDIDNDDIDNDDIDNDNAIARIWLIVNKLCLFLIKSGKLQNQTRVALKFSFATWFWKSHR